MGRKDSIANTTMAPANSFVLTKNEMISLTGCTASADDDIKSQLTSWLTRERFSFRLDLQGWPQVSRRHAEQKMSTTLEVRPGPMLKHSQVQTVAKPVGGPSINTVDELLTRYLAEIVPKKSPRSQYDNERQIEHLRAAFGQYLVDDVDTPMVYRYLDSRADSEGKPALTRANREVALLGHVYKYALRWGVATRSPCMGVMKHKEYARDRWILDHELDVLIRVAPPMLKAYIKLKYWSGLRKGDMLTLQRGAATEEGIVFSPRKTRRWDPRLGYRPSRKKIIPWTPELKAAWEEALAVPHFWCIGKGPKRKAVHVESPYLFFSVYKREGRCYYNESESNAHGFDAIWKRYMKKAKEKAAEEGWTLEHFTEHDIRAKTGTDAVAAGLEGHKVLGNTAKLFDRTYNRGNQVMVPLRRREDHKGRTLLDPIAITHEGPYGDAKEGS